uniref:Uncharacterized protein n=1 Tax=Salmonella phage vB_SEnST11_KE23 TaxID=3161174 RepID=A0AAU8GIF4_9CAUD
MTATQREPEVAPLFLPEESHQFCLDLKCPVDYTSHILQAPPGA